MPSFDLSPDTINSLFQNGHISDEVYKNLLASQSPADIAPPSQTPAAPVFDQTQLADNGNFRGPEEEARYQEQQKMFQDQQQAIQDMENRRAFAKKAGVPDETIDSKLPPLQLASDLTQPAAKPVNPMDQFKKPAPTDAGYEMQKRAVMQGAAATGAKTDAQSQILQQGMGGLDDLEANRQLNEQTRLDQENAKLKDLDATTQQIAQMNIDPNRFWTNKDTPNKIGTGIALFLGSFGSTPDNKVASMLTSAVDKDISLQKYQIANARDNLAAKGNVLSQMRAIYGDERQAEEATRIAALEKIKMQVMQKALQYSSPEVKANANKLVGELDVKKNEAKANFIKATNNPMGLSPEQQFMREKYDNERMTPLGMVKDPRDTPIIKDAITMWNSMKENLAKQQELAAEYSGFGGTFKGAFSIDDSKKAKALATELRQIVNKAHENGVMNPGDLSEIQKMIPDDVTSSTVINPGAQLRTIQDIFKDKYISGLNARGLSDPNADRVIYQPKTPGATTRPRQ